MAWMNKEGAKAIRDALKKEFGKDYKFSVTKSDSSVNVSLMSSPLNFSKVWEGMNDADYRKDSYADLNHYYLERYPHIKFLEKIQEIILTAPATVGRPYYDNSDVQTDYFDVSYYYSMKIGKYGKSYEQVA